MNSESTPNAFPSISRGGTRLKPLALFIAVAVSGGAVAADSKPLELEATQIEDSACCPPTKPASWVTPSKAPAAPPA